MSYTEITEKEFEYILSHLGKSGYTWERLKGEKAKENVYMININNVHIKIFSSLVNGVSRNVGSDAIRVVGWDIRSNRPIMSSEESVYRTENWNVNLRKRIESVISKIIDCKTCTICGGTVVKMKGKNGKTFDGCLEYKTNPKHIKLKSKVVTKEFWE